MKKIFTLATIVGLACAANAQTQSWSVVNEDGTLKEVYKANEDKSKASVVEFSTTNVSGTHVSGPVAGYKDGDKTPLEADVDNGWGNLQKKPLSEDGSVVPFYYVQGKGNPVNLDKIEWEEVITDGNPTGTYRADWTKAYYEPDGTAGLPKNGTYVTVKANVAGSMKVAVWINKGSRDMYVVKGSDAKALALGTEVKASGYVNGANNDVEEGSPLYGYPRFQENIAPKGETGSEAYVVGAGNQPTWGYLTFDAAANETYYIFNKSTQIGFSGIEFTPGETGSLDSIIADGDDADAPTYNIYGHRVGPDYKGLVIRNGKKFIQK